MPKEKTQKYKLSVENIEKTLIEEHIIDQEVLNDLYQKNKSDNDDKKIAAIVILLKDNLKETFRRYKLEELKSFSKEISLNFLQAKSDIDDEYVNKVKNTSIIFMLIMFALFLICIWF